MNISLRFHRKTLGASKTRAIGNDTRVGNIVQGVVDGHHGQTGTAES